METASDVDDGEPPSLTLRPGLGSRAFAWTMVALGVIFALSGLAAGHVSDELTMLAAGGCFASVGWSVATARLTVRSGELRYRNGLRRVVIQADQVASVEVGPGSGPGYARLAIHVCRRDGRHVRLTALQRPTNARARADLEVDAQDITRTLGLPGTP